MVNVRKKETLWNILFLAILLLYPMRHVSLGLDLWDTGYNYANFLYMGVDHMDPMWLYSTYLAHVLGHVFTFLPFGKTLIGLNVYSGLLVSGLAIAGYFFGTIKMKIPAWIVFLGEFLAINLCWCPTAVLYNYLTYVLFFAGAVFVYLGLVKEKSGALIIAGVCLGTNVLVRFSNLPEAGLILAVWAYGFWKKENKGNLFKVIARDTGWCLLGYLGSLFILAMWIQVRYGLGEYVQGIQRLFAMTETATNYQGSSMLLGLVLPLKGMIYYVLRALLFPFLAVLIVSIMEYLQGHGKVQKVSKQGSFPFFLFGEVVVTVATLGAMVYWLYQVEFASFEYYSYDTMYRPAIFLLMLSLGIAVLQIILPYFSKEEKLYSLVMMLILLLTSLGSNNNVYPSINNLFLIAPYTLYQMVRFTRWTIGENKVKTGLDKIKLWPIALGAWTMVGMLFVHGMVFGIGFVFAESTGVQEFGGEVYGNEALRGVRMSQKRAAWMQELTDYINAEKLQGKEMISFGNIPAISFCYQMPAAFNPWCDLSSYHYLQMEQDMRDMEEKIDQGQEEVPVVILEHTYHLLAIGQRSVLEEEGMNPEWLDQLENSQKWKVLLAYIEKYDYHPDHVNQKLAVWR